MKRHFVSICSSPVMLHPAFHAAFLIQNTGKAPVVVGGFYENKIGNQTKHTLSPWLNPIMSGVQRKMVRSCNRVPNLPQRRRWPSYIYHEGTLYVIGGCFFDETGFYSELLRIECKV